MQRGRAIKHGASLEQPSMGVVCALKPCTHALVFGRMRCRRLHTRCMRAQQYVQKHRTVRRSPRFLGALTLTESDPQRKVQSTHVTTAELFYHVVYCRENKQNEDFGNAQSENMSAHACRQRQFCESIVCTNTTNGAGLPALHEFFRQNKHGIHDE